jgi:Ca2+-binding RTX toxin-like protein
MADISAGPNTKAVLEGDAGAGTFSGQLEFAGDRDWIKVSLSSGTTYEIYLCFLNTGSATDGDSFLRVHNATGVELADNDDRALNGSGNSALTFVAPSTGTFYIDVGEYQDNNTGAYSLFVLTFFGIDSELTPAADVHTGSTNERTLGGKGNDQLSLGPAGRQALGEQGDDIIAGNDLQNIISGGIGNDTITGAGGQDFLFGDAGKDSIDGGDDFDSIYGGAGKDRLTGGGDGDSFIYSVLADSRKGAARDVITDFRADDVIDLIAIDAKNGGGNQAFRFIGKQDFHGIAGELHFETKNLAGRAHDRTFIQGDVNGDGRADFEIELVGLHNLHKGDFEL